MTTTKKEVEEEWRTRMVQNVHFIRKGQARGENCKETSLRGSLWHSRSSSSSKKKKKENFTAISEQWLKKLWRIRSTTSDGMKRVRHEIGRSLSASLRLSLARARARDNSRGVAPPCLRRNVPVTRALNQKLMTGERRWHQWEDWW